MSPVRRNLIQINFEKGFVRKQFVRLEFIRIYFACGYLVGPLSSTFNFFLMDRGP
jgi:hypothetical protein